MVQAVVVVVPAAVVVMEATEKERSGHFSHGTRLFSQTLLF